MYKLVSTGSICSRTSLLSKGGGIFGGLSFQLPFLHQLLSNAPNCYMTAAFIMLLYEYGFIETKSPIGLK